MKLMTESLEAMKKQNEDLASRFPVRVDQEQEEKCEVRRKEKQPVDYVDDESSSHGNHDTTVQGGENSRHDKSHCERTLHE
jgi:hypothetical protein